MKTASKVFICISLAVAGIMALFGIYLFLESIACSGADYDNLAVRVRAITLLIPAAVVIVVGILSLKKLNVAKTKKDLEVMAILTMIFCSLLAGIFMLCMDEKELQESKKNINDENKEKNNLDN